MAIKTLYVHRPLLNAGFLADWANDVGFGKVLHPSKMHVTNMFSKTAVEWDQFTPLDNKLSVRGGVRTLEQFDGGAVVMKFEVAALQDRFDEFLAGGCSYDYPEYKAHVTITYEVGDVNISTIEPFKGVLLFGPEEFEEVNLNWVAEMVMDK